MVTERKGDFKKESGPHVCVFCEIVRGSMESSKILETESSVAFMAMEGHAIVIPKKHIGEKDVYNDPSLLNDTLALALKLVKPTKEALGATGINLVINIGKDAGQRVDHAHVHLINRNPGDKKANFPHIPSLSRPELDKRAENIRLKANLS